jgi:hypothetical protein
VPDKIRACICQRKSGENEAVGFIDWLDQFGCSLLSIVDFFVTDRLRTTIVRLKAAWVVEMALFWAYHAQWASLKVAAGAGAASGEAEVSATDTPSVRTQQY